MPHEPEGRYPRAMAHYDYRKAVHDPNPPPRPPPPPARPITLNVDRIAARLAAKIRRHPADEWPGLVRLHAERLLEHLEAGEEARGFAPSDIDVAVARFVWALEARLNR